MSRPISYKRYCIMLYTNAIKMLALQHHTMHGTWDRLLCTARVRVTRCITRDKFEESPM